jgi:hypothetical protein
MKPRSGMSLDVIRKIGTAWGIPADLLITAYKLIARPASRFTRGS